MNGKQVKLVSEPDWIDKFHAKDGCSKEIISFAKKLLSKNGKIEEKKRALEVEYPPLTKVNTKRP